MTERKVLNKYFPPDFDPEKLVSRGRLLKNQGNDRKKKRGPPNKQMNVRFMFPFTLCCSTCAEFVYVGTKFNSRVEKILGEDYLGIAIWRFYGRCPHCRAEIIFKTDPKNTEYVLESGGTRTYNPERDAELAESTLKDKLEQEISTDSMKALEHKTYNTANELQSLEHLDDLKKINKRFMNREQTIEDTLKWLSEGGLSKSTTDDKNKGETLESSNLIDGLDEEDFLDLKRAKIEMAELQFKRSFANREIHSSDEGSPSSPSSNSDNASSSDNEATSKVDDVKQKKDELCNSKNFSNKKEIVASSDNESEDSDDVDIYARITGTKFAT